MRMAVLPIEGRSQLCAIEAGTPRPLAEAPGLPDARYFLSHDGSSLAVIDDREKRAALFEVLPEAPWLRRSIPFGTLPRRCVGKVALGVDGTLFVGGSGKSGEALWRNAPARDGTWVAVDLPEGLRKSGKAIDGLHQVGDRLLAVDDLVIPKWMLIYRITAGAGLELERQVRLPVHTSYEHVIHSSIGPEGPAFVSRGINHGRVSTHVWMLDPDSLEETRCWSALAPLGPGVRRLRGPLPWETREMDSLAPARERLLNARCTAQLAGHLVVACGKAGTLVIDLRCESDEESDDALLLVDAPGLPVVESIVEPAPADGAGVFLVGRGEDGVASAFWLAAGDLAEPLSE